MESKISCVLPFVIVALLSLSSSKETKKKKKKKKQKKMSKCFDKTFQIT